MKYDELVLKTAPATGSIWHLLGSFVLQVGSDNNECCSKLLMKGQVLMLILDG